MKWELIFCFSGYYRWLFSSVCLVLVVLFLDFSALKAQDSYTDLLKKERLQKDEELGRRKTSPLQKTDRKNFDHLRYFEVDTSWNKQANYQRLSGGDTIDFATSSGRIKQFVRYARLSFGHNGQRYAISAYKRVYPPGYVPPYAPSLFVPFTDLTTGDGTYGGGRYMDIEIPQEESTVITLDFNRCYNPYCAYGSGFSCPIPPEENFMDLRVEAGEKNYEAH